MGNLLNVRDVLARCRFCRKQLYNLMGAGRFPQPVRIDRNLRFMEAEINAWLAERVAARDAALAGRD